MTGFSSDGRNCWSSPNSRFSECRGLDKGEVRIGFANPCGRCDCKNRQILYSVRRASLFLYALLIPNAIVVTVTLMAKKNMMF